VANTKTNETIYRLATIGPLIERGGRITTATSGPTIACLGRTDVGSCLLSKEIQEAGNYPDHCDDDAPAEWG
jgi:hypothetical protein